MESGDAETNFNPKVIKVPSRYVKRMSKSDLLIPADLIQLCEIVGKGKQYTWVKETWGGGHVPPVPSFPLPIVTGPEEALIGQAIASSYSYNTAHKVCHLARVDKGHSYSPGTF